MTHAAEPITESVKVDVAIVGGGLLGCAAAYYLSKAGASVMLVEKGQLNRQASGQNAGSLHFQLEYRAIEHGDEVARHHARQIPLNVDAQARWFTLEEELDADLEVVQTGGLMVAETADEVDALKRKAELERSFGLHGELITGDDARTLVPALSRSVQAALLHDQEGHANPRLVTPAFLRSAERLGARVRTEERVCRLQRGTEGFLLSTASGLRVQSDVVLNCAGIWIGEIAAMLGVQLPIVPVALQMHCTEAAPPTLDHLIQHIGHRLSMKQMHEGNFLVGGGWPSRMAITEGRVDKESTPGIAYDSMVGNLTAATRVVPALRNLHLIRVWTGMTALTVDQVPLLGEVAGRPGFFVVGGGSAFTLGPTYAKLVSELILTGRTEIDVELFSPHRFAHLTF